MLQKVDSKLGEMSLLRSLVLVERLVLLRVRRVLGRRDGATDEDVSGRTAAGTALLLLQVGKGHAEAELGRGRHRFDHEKRCRR